MFPVLEQRVMHLLPFVLLFYCINIDEVFLAKTISKILVKKDSESLIVGDSGNINLVPQQVHIAHKGPGQIYISWVTLKNPGKSYVQWGENENFDRNSVDADSTWFLSQILTFKFRYVHHAAIRGVKPGEKYSYRVGNGEYWSHIFTFTGLKERQEGGFKVAVYGDFGADNPRSLNLLTDLVKSGGIDFVMHVGDIAYNLDTNGDRFMNQIEPIASRVPYMVSPGNHEIEVLPFHNYVYRFNMPGGNDNHFYSYDLGKAHIISFSTEFYYLKLNQHNVRRQFEWLKKDLEKASKNRHNVPWIITLGHRPMYCSTDDLDDCRQYENKVRVSGLEKLFYDFGVDLEVWGHEHTYERLFPVYDRKVFNITGTPYIDPPAPVHIITGSAGCRENTDKFINRPEVWSAFRSSNYGISMMQVFNSTHLHWQQIRADTEQVEDDVWIIKNTHGNFQKHSKKLNSNSVYVPYTNENTWFHSEQDLNRTQKKKLI